MAPDERSNPAPDLETPPAMPDATRAADEAIGFAARRIHAAADDPWSRAHATIDPDASRAGARPGSGKGRPR